MENKKIKVVWVCRVSNEEIRNRIHIKNSKLFFLKGNPVYDCAQWNTNAINEFKRFNDVELHLISPHVAISPKLEEFTIDGIHYHIFKSEDDNLSFKVKRRLLKGKYETPDFKKNSKTILSIINRINPDLIHLIGAENPIYSSSALSIPREIPLIVGLQTLMCDPKFKENYPISEKLYKYRSGIEVAIIKKAHFVCCKNNYFRNIIWTTISDKIRILDLSLAVGENITKKICEKVYTFVYFAKEIEKAADLAIEAFAIANKKHPEATMRIIGGYGPHFKKQLDDRMTELNIADKVSFSGSLPTHKDVINEVHKARFAVLPLKIDLISGTIREAMANGIPVVTTITPGTPKLNEKRKSVLLSEKGDHNAMAQNMISLIENKEFADALRSNAYETIKERYDNEAIIKEWRNAYYEVLENRKTGAKISMEIINNNGYE